MVAAKPRILVMPVPELQRRFQTLLGGCCGAPCPPPPPGHNTLLTAGGLSFIHAPFAQFFLTNQIHSLLGESTWCNIHSSCCSSLT